MATTITVSYSELDTYRQCPLKHKLGYLDLWSKDAQEGTPLSRGGAWHAILEAHYNVLRERGQIRAAGHLREISPGNEKLILNDCLLAVHPHLYGSDGSQTEQQELLAWMYLGHVQQYGIDRDWQILAVEAAGSTRLLTERGYASRFLLKFKIDLVVRDLVTGQLKIVDHKSAANFSRPAEIDIDDQFGLYAWALSQRGHKVLAIVRSDARTQRNKGPMRLEDRYRRIQTFRSDKELANIALDAYRTAKQAYAPAALVHSSPAPDRCTWRCDFLEPHLAMRKGLARPEQVLTDFGFYQRDVKHREYTPTEGQS